MRRINFANKRHMADSKVNDILVFLSVVDTGSFASGGKAFGLSRSTAGKAVARLEDRYGVRLLNRTTRAISIRGKPSKRRLPKPTRAWRARTEFPAALFGSQRQTRLVGGF